MVVNLSGHKDQKTGHLSLAGEEGRKVVILSRKTIPTSCKKPRSSHLETVLYVMGCSSETMKDVYSSIERHRFQTFQFHSVTAINTMTKSNF